MQIFPFFRHLVILFILLNLSAAINAQTLSHCDSLQQKRFKIGELVNLDRATLLEDMRKSILCGHDSVDMTIFMGPTGDPLQSLIPILTLKNTQTLGVDSVSLGEFAEMVTAIKQMPNYQEMKSKVAAMLKQQGGKLHLPEDAKGKYVKYMDGLFAYNDYKQGMIEASKAEKPALIYFNAQGSINAKKVDLTVLSRPEIQDIINEKYIFIVLVVDDQMPLPSDKRLYSNVLKREMKYAGDYDLELEISKFDDARQPLFAIVDGKGKKIRKIIPENATIFMEFLRGSDQ